MSPKTSHKAFTIIELLVVVTIIALLTAIITSNLANSKSKSRDAKRVSDIIQLQLSLELFFDRCNRYPITEVVAGANMPRLTDPINDAARNGCPVGITLSTFTSKIPGPPTALDYLYVVNNSSIPTDYLLRAKLENANQALTDDLDGTIMSTDCSDTTTKYFCVQPR